MSGFWKGYVAVNDDVRHTYEQVFYGRQLTDSNADNLPKPTEAGPGMTPAAPDAPAATEPSHAHAEFYSGIWGETLPPEPGGIHGAPQLDHGQTIDGTATPGAPQIEAPAIEAPKIEPPRQGDDMTPGY